MHTFKVEQHEAGQTLLQFLQQRIPAAGRGYLRQLLKKGRICSEDKAWQEDTPVYEGQCITLGSSARLQELLTQPTVADTELGILFESKEMLVVDKPAGVAVHSSSGHEDDNITSRVQDYLQGKRFQVAPIHRLDVGTSGPVLFGKGKKACAALGTLFMRHEVEKVYVALVSGNLQGSGALSRPLSAKGKVKSCYTTFSTLKRTADLSLVELVLITGRQHQIRRQLALEGHPVVGDGRYGGVEVEGLEHPFLHCSSIAFTDPFSGTPLKIESKLPSPLQDAMSALF
ncbi:MAG: RluA family pseudouridine synthase [Geobacteraceae bacterium]|nr:RluA family pseudouridine synthase [Geobacteraceae bacterium]